MNPNLENGVKPSAFKRQLQAAAELLWSTWESGTLTTAELDRMENEFKKRHADGGEPECLWLLSEIQVYRSRLIRRTGAEAALEGLRQAPESTGLHDNYVACMDGALPDFHKRNHHRLIAEYERIVERHPELLIARRILIEHLIADYRFDEAEIHIAAALPYAAGREYVLDFYISEILYRKGERRAAERLWSSVCRRHPGDSACLFLLGEQYAKFARYEEAANAYERSFALQQSPRRIDALEALVHVHEIRGDDASLLHALSRILNVLAQDYGITEGAEADPFLRQRDSVRRREAVWS
ncbi:hypothetical protein [Saccharibacillus sacchari]|uniref:Uncharacterized protein n=1 Tax=Saccharibacillus sacchari TaxID=456493 RepID=A0ACC6PAI4_9BACL